MSEQDEKSSTSATTAASVTSNGPNLRGGPSSGATRLNDIKSNSSAFDSQSCQC